MERKYLTEWKRFLTEQQIIRIGTSEISNAQIDSNSITFKPSDLDSETYQDSGLVGMGDQVIIKVNNLIKQNDGSYKITGPQDIELPNLEQFVSDEFQSDLPNMKKQIKDRLAFRFEG
jgi:hypothetical protein